MIKIFRENRIINEAVPAEWFFLTKRPDMPPLPVWYKIKCSALSKENKRIYGTGVPWVCFWHDGNVEHYLHGKEYRLAIQTATKILYSRYNLNKHLIKLKQACQDAKKEAMALDNLCYKGLSNRQLLCLYTSVVNKYVLSYVYGFITWCTPVLQSDAKSVINNYDQALNKIKTSPDEAMGILIVPDVTTIYQEKEEALNKLSKKYKQVLSAHKSKSFVLNNYPKLYKEIEEFINRYRWVGFNYIGPALNYEATVDEILQSRDKVQSSSPTKKDIYKACKFSNKEKQIFYALEMISYTKDLRNVTDDYVHYCFNNFYKEVARRTGMEEKDVRFLWDDELNALLAGKNKIKPGYIKNKRKYCAALSSHKTMGVKQYYLGDEAKNFRERVFKNSNQLIKTSFQGIIKGTIASIGMATGTVKIIHSASEVGKVKKGDILVAGMTSPKYMPAILNSSAIITDDGGLTNHAAIIARELKKPCIIGTKIATSVLHDGDFVEVDANHGWVRKLKK